jgi:hypothetical protein
MCFVAGVGFVRMRALWWCRQNEICRFFGGVIIVQALWAHYDNSPEL